MNKVIELAKKLKALADKGVGGEKINAEKMLQALLKKHNITIEEIEGEKINDFFFMLKKEDFQLFYQVLCTVNKLIPAYGEYTKTLIRKYKWKGNYMIRCTPAEYIEIEAKFNFYLKLFNEEKEVLLIAFVSANQLYSPNAGFAETEKMSEAELEKALRAQQLSQSIKKGQYLKQLK